MRKYQSYKPSRVDWVGEIPDTWEETYLKYVGNLYGGLTGKSGDDFNQEDNPNNKPYIPYTNIFRNTYISKNHVDYVVLEYGENQNKVQKFDLFFLMSSETYQDLGKSCILIDDVDELYLNSFCKGLRVKRKDVNPLFLNYQLLGSIHKELISIEGRGFTRINLRQDRLNETPIFLPPLQEQHQIVQFLDEKTELIDKLISKKERKITLLQEQRTSLINQVVTKGLNPNVKMKDSGVEWIGEIPDGWKIGKLYQYTKLLSGSTPLRTIPEYWENGDIPWMSSGEINKRIIKNIDGRITKLGNEKSNTPMLPINTVLIGLNGQGKTKGTVGILEVETTCNQSLCGIICNSFIKPYFLFYFLDSQYYHLRGLVGEGKREGISVSFLSLYPLLIPSIIEQIKIVEYLDSKTKEIDDLVLLEQKKIDLLKEYRQSLISEVVTGKIKVTE